MMFAQQNTSAHAPSIALLEEGRSFPAQVTETTPCLTTEMTVADPDVLAGHPQLKAPGQHATNGARAWGVSNGAWSDDEVWLKDRAVCPRTSGYLSAEDMKNPHRSADRAKMSEQTLPQRLAQQYNLKSTDDFTAPSTVFGEQQVKTIGGDPVLSVTQNQLMEIVRRACHELTATPFSDSLVCPKQLSYGSPHTVRPAATGFRSAEVRSSWQVNYCEAFYRVTSASHQCKMGITLVRQR